MRKAHDIKKEIVQAGLPLDRVYTRIIPFFTEELKRKPHGEKDGKLEIFEEIYRQAENEIDPYEYLVSECKKRKIPLDTNETSFQVEVYFTRSLTNEESRIFEDIYKGTTMDEKRKREYPSMEEFAEAFSLLQSGDSSKMDSYNEKIKEVNKKYLIS